jgi:hypothetical protein
MPVPQSPLCGNADLLGVGDALPEVARCGRDRGRVHGPCGRRPADRLQTPGTQAFACA